MHAASRLRYSVDQRILDRLEECLSSSVIDLRASTDLVLSDALLLSRVVRDAERRGGYANQSLSNCVVICGSSRLLRLCKVLRAQSPPVSNHSRKLRAVTNTHRKLVC